MNEPWSSINVVRPNNNGDSYQATEPPFLLNQSICPPRHRDLYRQTSPLIKNCPILHVLKDDIPENLEL